jgi:sarcosine oxidase subunit gamma
MTTVNVYQQRPGNEAKAEAPLFHADLPSQVGKARANPGVILRDRQLLGHLTLRGHAEPAFASAVQQATGLALPGALEVVSDGDTSLQWIGPDEWLLIVPGGEEFATEQRLRAALGDLHVAIVNVSGGQSIIELSGPNIRDVFMKSTSYDVHPRNFPVGKAVGTVFAKSQLVIRHTAEDTWELLVRRSFSDYWWMWLQDASAEYGLEVRP